MSSFTVKPAQVFAAINVPTDQAAPAHAANSKNALANNACKASSIPEYEIGLRITKDIQVTATGELVLEPDICRFIITVSSRKEAVQDVKNSVSRRIDYVLQILRNHQIKENEFKVSQSLQRIDGHYQLDADVVVNLHDYNKFQLICNLLVEKLNEHVRVTGPEFDHTPSKVEAIRRQAAVLALRNGKQKATDLAQVVNAKVGRVLGINEEIISEWEGLNGETSNDISRPISFDQRVKEATMHIVAKLVVTFELLSKQKSKELKTA